MYIWYVRGMFVGWFTRVGLVPLAGVIAPNESCWMVPGTVED